MPEVNAGHLSNAEIDGLLQRFDATDPVLQRRIVVQLAANLHKAEKHKAALLAACKLALDECSIFFRTDGELMSALADAIALAENSADCS